MIFFFQLPNGNPFILPVYWYTAGRGGSSLCVPYKLQILCYKEVHSFFIHPLSHFVHVLKCHNEIIYIFSLILIQPYCTLC